MAQLTKEQQAAIDNYSKDIVTLKDSVTATRKMPGMFCGGMKNRAFTSLIREVYQNSIDQIMDSTSPADTVTLFYDENTLVMEISDNGKGFPFQDMVRMITSNHTSKNYTKVKGQYSSGRHGVGLKIVAHLSTECHVSSYRYDGTAMRLDLKEGYIVGNGPYPIPNKEKRQGSVVRFIPSTEVLGEINLPWKKVYNLIKDILSLTPIGSKVQFEAIDKEGVSHKEFIVNKDGIITKLINNISKPLCAPIVIGYDNGEFKLDLAMCYDMGEDGNTSEAETVTAFCNMCPTIAGEHISGSIDGISRWFSNYMNNIYLINQKAKNKTKVTFSDIKCGLNVMISGFCLEPTFVGQAKEQLNVPEMEGFCKDVVMKGLDEWSKTNPSDLVKLSKFFKEIAELRMKNETGRAKITQKFQKNSVNDLPQKYIRPLQNKGIELFIVEGDSAMGSVKEGRDPQRQGIMPIRGKIINAFGHSRREVFENAEVQAITQIILGSEYHRNFTLDEVKVDKVIFLADADVDGAHISALLLRLFVMYFPQLIEAGMVYKGVPPLYSIKEGKKHKFFTEQIDIVKFIQKDFLSKHSFLTKDKKELDNREITKFFLRNADYTYYLMKAANTYAVDPYLLEMTLFNYIQNNHSIDEKKLLKSIKSTYRFMNVENKNGQTVISGSIEESNLIICRDKLFNDCANIIDIIEKNDSLYYNMDNKLASLYQVMMMYEESTPPSVQRYKGLGEMPYTLLSQSTLDPNQDRSLIRYTMDDIKEATSIIREYESDTKKILGEVKRIDRFDLLD